MLHWLQERLRQVASAQLAEGRRFFDSLAIDTAARAHALLQSDGYTVVRYLLGMTRPIVEEIPDAPLPQGLEVRPAQPEHYRAIWDAANEAFRDDRDAFRLSEEQYQALLNDPVHFVPDLWQVAWDGDQVAGLVTSWIDARENEEYHRQRGYIGEVCVGRPWRRRGLARALIHRSLRLLRERGMTEAFLNVDAENISGALRLYERCGFQTKQRRSLYRKPLD